jgi:hypothetical protein
MSGIWDQLSVSTCDDSTKDNKNDDHDNLDPENWVTGVYTSISLSIGNQR